MVLSSGVWAKENPLSYAVPHAVPLFIVQLTLIVLATHVIVFILKPLRQPRVISEILVEMIVLNVGRNQKVIDEETFAIMVIMAVIMTGLITPTVTAIYRPAHRFVPYNSRTIQRSKADGELRILACIHNTRKVATMINLIDATNPTKRTPIFVYALHLVELTGRPSAMLVVHTMRKRFPHGKPLYRTQAESDHIVSAFEHYQHQTTGVAVQSLTAIFPHSTMYKDVCDLAQDKRVALLLLPLHKQQTVDGGMEVTSPPTAPSTRMSRPNTRDVDYLPNVDWLLTSSLKS